MKRIQFLKESIVEREDKLKDLRTKLESEARMRTPEEREESENLTKEIDELRSELDELEVAERRKGATPAPAPADLGSDTEERSKVEIVGKMSKEKRDAKVFKMFQGIANNNVEQIKQARQEMLDGEVYGKEQREGFNTLSDNKGGILVPTVVSSEIMDIAQQYGVIPALANNFGNILQTEVKVPQVMSRPTFSAVNQGSAISGSGLNLGGIVLKASKWGTIIDWTNEIDESVGATLIPIIQRKIAEGFAYSMDNAFFKGDGTSAYNGIKGLDGLDGAVDYVQQSDAATGHTAFASVDADDILNGQFAVTAGARNGGVYVFHPDFLQYLYKMQDGRGAYIYGMPSELMPQGSIWGKRIVTSEAFHYTDGTDSIYGAFFNPQYVAFATGRALTATRLVEGTITDEDSNSVNLSTMDAQALRFTGLFDIVLSSITRTNGGSAQGAFAVLRTTS